MGYDNDLYVTADGVDIKAIMRALNEVQDYCEFYETSAELHTSVSYHFDHDAAFFEVSKRFPLAVIALEIWPEETYYNGITKVYYLNGVKQEVQAEITFPPCKLTPPKTEYRTVNVVILGREIPVEVEVLAGVSEKEAYQIAKQQIKNIL